MIHVSNIPIGGKAPLVFILGPCVIESETATLHIAESLKKNCPYPFLFKASFDKANRSSIDSFRGPGLKKGLSILKQVKKTFQIPVTTDIHEPSQAPIAAEIVDLLQIPAFLCRQTDLLVAAAKTGRPINVKKGQFLAPKDMSQVIEKIKRSGPSPILVTERGSCFGYHNLVFDPRSIDILKSLQVPVCFDASHSLQLPGKLLTSSSGEARYVPFLAKSAIVCGANALFIETHPNPKLAKSDAKTQWPLPLLWPLLESLHKLHVHMNHENIL